MDNVYGTAEYERLDSAKDEAIPSRIEMYVATDISHMELSLRPRLQWPIRGHAVGGVKRTACSRSQAGAVHSYRECRCLRLRQ
jgi:hypothetical protein